MKRILILVLFMLFVTIGQMSYGFTVNLYEEEAEPEYYSIIRDYIGWITENSDLAYQGEPLPSVKFVPQEQMKYLVYDMDTIEQAEASDNIVLPDVQALYDHNVDMMILPAGFDFADMSDNHMLLHELVHYLQDINGRYEESDCVQRLEKPAYELHWQWVQEYETGAKEPNWLFVYTLEMACQDMHPNIAP